YKEYSDALARKLFRFSILYLALLFGALLIDHWVMLLYPPRSPIGVRMSLPFSLRSVFSALAIICALMLAGCGSDKTEFRGSDISGSKLGADLAMVDDSGQPRTLADYKGKVVVAFFGFTQCPDVCPTSMSQLAHVMELLESDADKVQVLMILVDPERDTPEILSSYVKAFNPDFVGLTGSPEQLAATAK